MAIETKGYLLKPNGEKLAYSKIETSFLKPGIFFLGGFMSSQAGTKATALSNYCLKENLSFIRFDYSGYGLSEGNAKEATLGDWIEDAMFILDSLTKGPQIAIGSSMGGWIMFRLALSRQARFKALIGLAPAPDFTKELIYNTLSLEEKAHLEKVGYIHQPSPYETPYYISNAFLKEAKKHLLFKEPVLEPLQMPIRLIHGEKDQEVPWQTSYRLLTSLNSPDVRLSLIKDATHGLSRESDLNHLYQTIQDLL